MTKANSENIRKLCSGVFSGGVFILGSLRNHDGDAEDNVH